MNGLVIRLTLRQLIYGRRAVALALLPLAVAALAFVFFLVGPGESGVENVDIYARLAEQILIPSVIAFVALVLGASAIGDERDDGTILYLAATPLTRQTLATSKTIAAAIATLVVCAPGAVLTFIFALGSDITATAAFWSLLAVVFCSAAYCAAFCWLSISARRPVLIGFLYVILWESSISTFAPSARWFSIGSYGRALVAEGLPAGTDTFNVPTASAITSIIVLALAAAGLAAVAGWRLRHVELP